jgi:hypothetical protein
MGLIWTFILLAVFCGQLSCSNPEAKENELSELDSSTEESVEENIDEENSSSPVVKSRERRCARYDDMNVNLALNKNATQSSTFDEKSLPNQALDGNKDPDFYHFSCTHTGSSDIPTWWAVDLGKEAKVGRVRITNRGDCCSNRLKNFYIGLTNVTLSPKKPPKLDKSHLCVHYAGTIPGGVSSEFICAVIPTGRYLFVMLSKPEFLTICELEAYTK